MLKLFEEKGFAPRRCTWELTLACDLRCGHCGSRAGKPRPDELTTMEAFQVVDDLAQLGCRQITLAGGEPTLRPDWQEIIKRIRTHKMRVTLLSNGFTWSPESAQLARQAGVSQMGFSLDGLEATHDLVRRRGSFAKVKRSVEYSRAEGIRVAIVTTITQHNLAELEEMHQLLASWGVVIWQLQQGVPVGNLSESPEWVITREDMRQLVPRLAAIKEQGKPKLFPADNIGYYGEYEERLRGSKAGQKLPFWLGCRAGLEVIGIESHGDVKGCLSMPSSRNGLLDYVEGNVRERSLVEIWRDPDAFSYNRKFSPEMLEGDCKGCEFAEICRGGCSVTSIGHHGNPFAFPNCYYAVTREEAES